MLIHRRILVHRELNDLRAECIVYGSRILFSSISQAGSKQDTGATLSLYVTASM